MPNVRSRQGEMIDYLSEYSPETALKQYDRVIERRCIVLLMTQWLAAVIHLPIEKFLAW